jgi:hypothetical protein
MRKNTCSLSTNSSGWGVAAKSKYDNERELAETKETNAYAWVTPPGARLANECGVMSVAGTEREQSAVE